MTTWWWVRHGPTHRREMNGWTDVPADLSGNAALERLTGFLPKGVPVISSDLVRAVATADAIQGARLRLPHDRALREIHFGAWEGRPFEEIEREDPLLCRRYWEAPGDVRPPDGESWNDLRARVDDAVDRLADATGNVIAVSHFGTILSQVQRALGCSPVAALGRRIDNLSVTRLIRKGRHWSVGDINLVLE